DADALLPDLEEAVQRVEGRGRLVPGRDPHLRRGGEGEQHHRRAEGSGPPSPPGQHLHQGLARVEEPMRRWAVVAAVLLSLAARAQRPDEDALFGGKRDGGAPPASRPSEESLFGGAPDGGTASGAATQGGPASGAQESSGLDVAPSTDAF